MTITFTTLRELRQILNGLSDKELDAKTNESDWFEFYIDPGLYNNEAYYHIEPKFGEK